MMGISLLSFRVSFSAAESGPATLTLVVCDYAGVPADALSRAKAETARIYREIGIETMWAECGTSVGSATLVNILSRLMFEGLNAAENVLGRAASGTPMVRVLYPNVERVARNWNKGKDLGTILGHVIAHEVGHTLLPVSSHSKSGIMRADLDLQLAAQGRLLFTAGQGDLIRSRMTSTPRLMASR
jgi:hypothetical protein